jgi:hypothetical protein
MSMTAARATGFKGDVGTFLVTDSEKGNVWRAIGTPKTFNGELVPGRVSVIRDLIEHAKTRKKPLFGEDYKIVDAVLELVESEKDEI